MKNNKNKTNKTYTTVTKGVYKTKTGKYVVRPTINGKRLHISFTNLNKAKAYRKSVINS